LYNARATYPINRVGQFNRGEKGEKGEKEEIARGGTYLALSSSEGRERAREKGGA